MKLALLAVTVLASLATASEARAATSWRAGVARAVITPEKSLWMAGYGGRTKPAEGKLDDLWVKAIALEDAAGKRVVLVTLDVCGIDRKLSNTIRDRLQIEHQLGREAVALSSSHTHSGPVVGDNLRAMNLLTPDQQRDTTEYTAKLSDTVVKVVGDAIAALAPAKLSWTIGQTTFAVNRRENEEKRVVELREKGELKGPIDHDLPVLSVTSEADGKPIAIVFGYACHATVMSEFRWTGDWPGIACAEVERAHPGTTALVWIGCGADQNPLPRRTYALANRYGKQAADAVGAALNSGTLKPLDPAATLVTAYGEIDLPFGPLPTKEQLEADLKSADKFIANRAKILLGDLATNGKLPPHYPYPVQLWRLGPDLKWVFLGGEVVVDYSLRLKKELSPPTWVGAYMNDVMAYIPSARVLAEGRYEGETSMIYYCQPTKWAPEVEELIMKEVRRQVDETVKR